MSAAAQARTRRYVTAMVALGIVLGALWWWQGGGPANIDAASDGNSTVATTEVAASDTRADTPPAPAGLDNITLIATLIADGNIRPLPDQAYIGLGYFDPEDLEEYRRSGDSDPQRLADLAVIERWLDASLIAVDSDLAELTGEGLPAADVYRIIVKATDSGFYFGAHINTGDSQLVDLGDIYPLQAAGLELSLTGAASEIVLPGSQPADYPVNFQRQPQDHAWTLLRRLLYPGIEPVLLGDARLQAGERLRVYPLAPEQAITVTAQGAAGRQVSATSAGLTPGTVTPLALDISALLAQQDLLVRVDATIVDEYGDPLSGVRVLDHPDQNVRCSSGPLGQCRIADVDAGQISYFLLILDPAEAAQRGVPERFSVSFDPAEADLEQMAVIGTAQVEWQLPVYRRIVLDHAILPAADGPPYPIFSLQQYDEQTGWRTVPGEQFVPRTATEMAIAVREDDTYRVQAAASARYVLRSEAVTVSGRGGEFFAALQPQSPRTITLRISEQASGLPPERAMLMVSSGFSEGPENPLPVPVNGAVDLPITGVERLSVEVLYPDGRSQAFEVDTNVSVPVELIIDSAVD